MTKKSKPIKAIQAKPSVLTGRLYPFRKRPDWVKQGFYDDESEEAFRDAKR